MKKILSMAFIIAVILVPAAVAHADFWGGDDIVLGQILAKNIQQLIALQSILQNAQTDLALLHEINRGINDSLQLAQTIAPYLPNGEFQNLSNIISIQKKFREIFGRVPNSPNAPAEESVDEAVDEAVMMNNNIDTYSSEIDKLGEKIQDYSHKVSPGGAAKLTAQSLGVMLHVMTEGLRAQGTLLKLQAESVASRNRREKDNSAEYLRSARSISNAMQASNPTFETPRF